MRLRCEQLEGRDNPSSLWTGEHWAPEMRHPVPGWTGDVRPSSIVVRETEIGPRYGTGFVAGADGSAHVAVYDDTGALILDRVFLDPNYRGGGDLTAIGSRLYIAPLAGGGGGDHVEWIDIATGETGSFSVGLGENYRGGLTFSTADTDGDGSTELITLPIEGRGRLVAFDPLALEQTRSFFVADEGDARQWVFVGASVGVQVRYDAAAGKSVMGFVVEPLGDRLSAKIFTWDGVLIPDLTRPEDLADASRNPNTQSGAAALAAYLAGVAGNQP